ncbi:MAG: hypothetical protein IJE28_10565, partial [Oscillospiraceae bacterium]|nr:hypothetical protein [Oscillospiraceae bacterium]
PVLAFELEKIGGEISFSEGEAFLEPEEIIPGEAAPEEESPVEISELPSDIVPLYSRTDVLPGQLIGETGEIEENEIYGYVAGYELRKGHTLSISNNDYVFSVRKLENGSYSNMLKAATADSFTATEDMTVGMLIRKPDKSALTEEEIASLKIIDSQYGMTGVPGYAHRFTVEAETIEGGTATTRAAIFLPENYSKSGKKAPLIVMTNGYSAYLTESTWNGNTADNVGIIRNYLKNGYAVYVVNNTKNHTGKTPDLGCPQLVDSYLKAYEYIQKKFNVEEKITVHSRSFGTFAAVRIMLEVPEIIKCAVMTGPRVSIKAQWPGLDKAFIANRFGFEDTTGATYEADKMVGHDPYTDVDGDNYKLPPTFWMLAEGDSTEKPLEFIGKLEAHGNSVRSKTYSGIDHTGICTLNQPEPFADALAFIEEHGREKVEPEYFSGKKVSILGDSISTYAGISNNTDYNSTIGKNAVYYSTGSLGGFEQTWWQQTIDALGMELCVNNSWSGSTVLHTRSGTVGAYVDRCVQLHNDHTGENPDIIAVFMGTNDYSYYQSKLGTADVDYDKLITENSDGTFSYASPVTTCEAYAIMLHKMAKRYPDAEIYCLSLLPRRNPDYDGKDVVPAPTEFNAELKEIIEHFGCVYVDIETPIPADGEEFDKYIGDKRVHPNAAGMDKMTEALISTMLGEETTIYSISYDMENASSDISGATVLGGKEFSAEISANKGCDNLSVTVKMGGKDITEEVYSDGKILIGKVTGDIEISAKAIRPALDFRWEFDGTNLVSVGETENILKRLSGTTESGVFKNTYYSLENSVQLCHNRPWKVEFRASGTSWSGMIFSEDKGAGIEGNIYLFKTSSTSGFFGFGERESSQFHNYGVPLTALGVDTNAEHTYRIENRINEDGSNMAYLFVDGVGYGAMENYFIAGSNDQKTKVDWVSGKDFAFSYIGASSHAINNCKLDYIAVWENGEKAEPLSLRYDDRYDVSGKTVEIVDAGKPTSYKVGYGVAEGTFDDAVITLDGEKLIATGIGTAKVRIDGILYEITVEAAPISLLLLIGQSNMRGSEGNANQSIICPEGVVYATYGDDRGADNT